MHYLALWVGKILQKGLRFFKHGGGSLPGLLVLKIEPNFLKKVKYPKDIILISGTNGKSTITNMAYLTLSATKRKVICNLEGNNLKIGAVSLILDHLSFNNELNGDVLLLEVDELSVPRLMEDLNPSMIVINNFFRDQLDRAGEMENIVRKIETCLSDYQGKLILNGDDPSVARLALKAKEATISYFGFDAYSLSTLESNEASEGKFCPLCQSELAYTYYQYSHIGRFACPHDEFGKHDITYFGENISLSEGSYQVNGITFYSPYRTLFAFYNELALIALAYENQLDEKDIQTTLSSFKMNNGRMEEFHLKNDKLCILNLAKNPTGQNESLKYILSQNKPCVVGLVLNDLDADGHDVSWIYDAKMEYLCHDDIKEVIVSGTRYLDMALRVYYANYAHKITPIESLDDFVSYLNNQSEDVYIIANYTALQPTRKALKRGSQ